jgi:hypothetical protein
MRLQLGSALVAGLAVAAEASVSKEGVKAAGVKNVAIIGEFAVWLTLIHVLGAMSGDESHD